MPSRLSHHKSPRRHSFFEQTSVHASGSVDGRTPTSPRCPSWPHNTTWDSRASTRLKTAEALQTVVAAQRKAEKETKGWDHLPPTAQRVILAVNATKGTSIPTLPPPTIHHFLNARNVMALQADCSLTYAGSNFYLPTSFCQAFLQKHILAIPDPDALKGLSPLLIPLYSAEPTNAQQRAMRIQFLLSMG